MLLLALRGVRYNKGRYLATLVAILTGVAFFAASGFLADRVISSLEGNVDEQYGNVDAAIIPSDSEADEAFASELRIPGDVAVEILSVPGVEGREGVITGDVAFLGADGRTFANDATGRLWVRDEELSPLQLTEGSAPMATGEIVVDRGTADRHDLGVGDTATLLTPAGQFETRIVGISHFGSTDSIDRGGTVSLGVEDAVNWLNQGAVEFEAIYLRGGASQAELVAAVEPLVPRGYKVQSGEEFLADQRDSAGSTGRILKQGLWAFSILALAVGGFVIYNTFTVIVSQRVRELAVMAAIGATPRQIMRSLLYEGLVIGIIGSALGVAVGFALTFGLIVIVSALGVELPGSGLQIGATSVLGGLLIGTIITVVSVLLPARRAATTEPIEALRSAAVESSPFSKRRVVITLSLIGLGAAGLLFGGNAPVIGLGALLLFVGVIAGGPIFAVVGAQLTRPVIGLLGLEGRLAIDNVARNPQRTATTANALLIGVFLVTFVSVAGESLKDFAVSEVKELQASDFVLFSNGGVISEELTNEILNIPDVESVTPFRREAAVINGEPSAISAGDLDAMRAVALIEAEEGSIEDLAPGTIVYSRAGALGSDEGQAIDVGSQVTVTDIEGNSLDLTVVAVLKSSIDVQFTGSIVHPETFDSLSGASEPTAAFVDVVSGTQTNTKDAIESVTSLRPDINVVEGSEFARLISSIFDFMIAAVNGLLGMSVVIALIGIVNTLSLSIIERRRELGLLRAVGMTDERVQRMVRIESVIIAALGTITGVVLGLFFAITLVLAINRLADADLNFGFPVLTMVLIFIAGPVLGLFAALIPAWRSTKLDVLDAIQAT